MILVGVLGGLVALTVPSLLPHYWQSQLRHAAEDVAAFLHDARVAALDGGRCVRVRAEPARSLVAEEGEGSCAQATTWRRIAGLEPPRAGVSLRLPAPIAFGPAGRVSVAPEEPLSAVWITHARIPDQLAVVVERSGPICTLAIDASAPGAPRTPRACP